MTYPFGKSSLEKRATLHPDLQKVVDEASKTYNFSILEGFRNQQEQDKDYAEGKSQKKWPDGKHNKYPSEATDLAPYDIEGIHWKDTVRFGVMIGHVQAAAIRVGVKIRCGLDWDMDGRSDNEKFKDLGHIELVR